MSNVEQMLGLFNTRYEEAKRNAEALEQTKRILTESVEQETTKLEGLAKNRELHLKAIAVLEKLSSDAVNESFKFIETSLNDVLAKIFQYSPRKIRIDTGISRGKIPELRIELYAANNIKRDLKEDSGHGIRQLISLLCILCLICINGTRKFVVLDEVLSGLSRESRMAVNDILWSFASIGFQFVIVEHGFIPKGAKVYRLRLNNDVSIVENEFIEQNGAYLTPSSES